ncbi:hypothetical protein EXIGLDRAFT_837586 [Exidia glandulosa HHB12029]|uniref:F-box domain-containing protein n=1 Tax=Exidia glandulosa HHB12029 TaxID=1314781 RepID=A0A165GMN6_EXIGL|nr:hypothetical protein EXIGLDRAFT_837586 [Exidia glandulosa HHB12029]
MPNVDLCVLKEVAVISTERRNLSQDAQLAAGARVVALGDDVTLLIFHSLRLSDRITVSHVCAFWRALALGDPLLWTPALHSRRSSAFPLLWSRTAPVAIEVNLDIAPVKGPRNALTCLSHDISRITKLTITASAYISVPEWTPVFETLCQPARALTHLRIEGQSSGLEYWTIPSAAFLDGGAASRLQELVLHRVTISDFSVLPTTLRSLTYEPDISVPEVYALLRQCSRLQCLWVNISLDAFPDHQPTPPPPLQLQRLILCPDEFDAEFLQPVLDHLRVLECVHAIDLFNTYKYPLHGILRDFDAQEMTIQRTSKLEVDCDVTVIDSMTRFRRIRAANSYTLYHEFPMLWERLTTLTICGHLFTAFERPPSVPRLELLRLFYPCDREERTVEDIYPWQSGWEGHTMDRWYCPSLRTVEFALATWPDDDSGRSGVEPIVLLSTAITNLVVDGLSRGSVRTVIVRGDGLRVQSGDDEHRSQSFSLLFDTNPFSVSLFYTDPFFRGYSPEEMY